MKEDRFLTGILVVIGLLVVASIGVFFLREDTTIYQPETTPDGIVHNYILALEQADYEKAYGYLADKENKPSYDAFRQGLFLEQNSGDSIQIGEAEVGKDTASVEVMMSQSSGGLFFDRYSYAGSALLILQDDEWKILKMPYAYWSWDWYQDEN